MAIIIFCVVVFIILPLSHDMSDDHFDTYITLKVIGHANQDVSKNYGGGSRTICIMEDDDGNRYNTHDMCKFLKNDILKATMHHGKYMKNLILIDGSE